MRARCGQFAAPSRPGTTLGHAGKHSPNAGRASAGNRGSEKSASRSAGADRTHAINCDRAAFADWQRKRRLRVADASKRVTAKVAVSNLGRIPRYFFDNAENSGAASDRSESHPDYRHFGRGEPDSRRTSDNTHGRREDLSQHLPGCVDQRRSLNGTRSGNY